MNEKLPTTLERTQGRRDLLALLGAGGAAALATLLGRNGAQAAHGTLNASSSTEAPAIHGDNSNGGPGVEGTSNSGPGGRFESESGNGVEGIHTSTQFGVGVRGENSGDGFGVHGVGGFIGVVGEGGSGPGVGAHSVGGAGIDAGSHDSWGVIGRSRNPDKGGVFGESRGDAHFEGEDLPLLSGRGVHGRSGPGIGVLGESLSGPVAVGPDGSEIFEPGAGTGVRGRSGGGVGVEGVAGDSEGSVGVSGAGWIGVRGAGAIFGVYGTCISEGGFAGSFYSTKGPGVRAFSPGDTPAVLAISGIEAEGGEDGGLALDVVGKARFSTAGAGVVPVGASSVFVASEAVGPDSHISLTLTGNPGPRQLHWVERSPGLGFTVHLTPTDADSAAVVPFTYLIVEPASGGNGGLGLVFGDVDCDGDVDAVDALRILRHTAGLSPLPGTTGCPPIGAAL